MLCCMALALASRLFPMSSRTSYGSTVLINPLCGERQAIEKYCGQLRYFNPRSPCGERPGSSVQAIASDGISIHAPHAGSDGLDCIDQSGRSYFNPRSPCGERLFSLLGGKGCFPFQSTLPMRGATWQKRVSHHQDTISIHAPHAGSDHDHVRLPHKQARFQSTLPMRGATGICELHYGRKRNFNPRSPCGERLSVRGFV